MANKWIKWEGGPCPVKRGTLVDVKYRDGKELSSLPAGVVSREGRDACGAYWRDEGFELDIVAYRLSEAPKRPRTKAGKPKVETPKRKRVRKPVDDTQLMAKSLALAQETAESCKRTNNAFRDAMPAETYQAYCTMVGRATQALEDSMRNPYVVDYGAGGGFGFAPIKVEGASIHYGGTAPERKRHLPDSVILVALGIVSGAIATAACFLIFA